MLDKQSACYYVGFFSGAAVGGILLGWWRVRGWAFTLGTLASGVAVGFVAEQLYKMFQPDRRCPGCQTILTDSSAQFCTRCGQQLTLCPHCGYDIRATPMRCPECGADLRPPPEGQGPPPP